MIKDENLTAILTCHAAKYPKMLPCDAVKLIYQNEFGSGHMVSDEESCLRWLKEELKSAKTTECQPEDIGNGIVRLYLGALTSLVLTCRDVCRMFMYTAKIHIGNLESFAKKLDVLSELTAANKLPFTAQELDKYLCEYSNAGYPPVSHSEQYRQNYTPAYRIIDSRFTRLFPVIAASDKLRCDNSRTIIALDGRCASGKTTAAELLAYIWDAPVVHMDDFFLPPELRTPQRYTQVGGNVHYERFSTEVLPNLSQKKSFAYRPFDCSTMTYREAVEIPASEVIIVEGAYSLHPTFGEYADISVFCDIDREDQLDRIRQRDGEYVKVFEEKWIPLEEAYLAHCNVLSRCSFTIN